MFFCPRHPTDQAKITTTTLLPQILLLQIPVCVTEETRIILLPVLRHDTSVCDLRQANCIVGGVPWGACTQELVEEIGYRGRLRVYHAVQ